MHAAQPAKNSCYNTNPHSSPYFHTNPHPSPRVGPTPARELTHNTHTMDLAAGGGGGAGGCRDTGCTGHKEDWVGKGQVEGCYVPLLGK